MIEVPTYTRLPEGYVTPGRESIEEGVAETGLEFKGKSVPWAIAPEPVALPEALGEELSELGTTLSKGFRLAGQMLRGAVGTDTRERAEGFVASHVPDYALPQDRSMIGRQAAQLIRPDIVLTSERGSDETWSLNGGIAEVEARPGGTFMYAALLEGYRLGRKEYMQGWAEHFSDRPWCAVYSEEWAAYQGELQAFGDDLKRHGGKSFGALPLEEMTGHDANELVQLMNQEGGGHIYLFGDAATFHRSGVLEKARRLASEPGIMAYNSLSNFLMDTKATLALFKQAWFLDQLAQKFGEDHAERLSEWILGSYVLSVQTDQDVNFGRMLQERKDWVLKKAGFDRDGTEARGLVMPKDGAQKFEGTLRRALSGNDGPWIAQEFRDSRLPHSFYHPQTGEVDSFVGATRLSPFYRASGKSAMDLTGVMITGTFGSAKAHGGSGDEVKPGMSVMAPVVFGDTPGLTYTKGQQN